MTESSSSSSTMAESSATLSSWQWRFPNPFQCCLPENDPSDPSDYQQLPADNIHIDNVDDNAIAKSLQQPSSPSPVTKSDDVGIQNLITPVEDHLVEEEKAPTTMLPPHIDPKSRAHCIDCLIDAADRLHSSPAALYHAVDIFNRYLSHNHVEVEHLLLVGLACLTIASKDDGVGYQFSFQLYAYLRHCQNKIRRDELASTETRVLRFLDNETTAETTWSFLKKFVSAAAAGGAAAGEDESKSLECMAGYIAEVSLLSSSMLGFAPSVVAASSVFLARYVLEPSKKPWSDALRRCTTYEASDLRDCVVALHDFCYGNGSYYLPAVTIKYSKKKFRYVALKSSPRSIPHTYF